MNTRDPYQALGYEDDALLVSAELYAAFLRIYEGCSHYEDEQWLALRFRDLDGEPVSPRFIEAKWLALVDYHT